MKTKRQISTLAFDLTNNVVQVISHYENGGYSVVATDGGYWSYYVDAYELRDLTPLEQAIFT